MLKRNLNKTIKSGFTIAELLIAVAIISVLVAVSVPIFASRLNRAREVTCAANRRSLRSLIISDYMSDGTDIKTNFEKQIKSGQYSCPSGGTYSVIVSDDGLNCQIVCNLHDGAEDISSDKKASVDAQSVFSEVQNLVYSIYNESEKMEAFKKTYKYVSNDTLISYLKNNTSQRTMNLNGTTLIIRQCINNSVLSPSLNTMDLIKPQIIIFATPEGTTGWYTNYIYNPDDGSWYHGLRGYSVNDSSWEKVRAATIENTKYWSKVSSDDFS